MASHTYLKPTVWLWWRTAQSQKSVLTTSFYSDKELFLTSWRNTWNRMNHQTLKVTLYMYIIILSVCLPVPWSRMSNNVLWTFGYISSVVVSKCVSCCCIVSKSHRIFRHRANHSVTSSVQSANVSRRRRRLEHVTASTSATIDASKPSVKPECPRCPWHDGEV